MTTQPLYFGNELDAFVGSDNTVVETTASGTFDATYTRCSIQVSPGATLKSIKFSPQTAKIYVNFCVNSSPVSSGEYDLFWLLDNSGTTVFKMTANRNSGSTYLAKMYLYNGSGFTAIGNGTTVTEGGVQYYTLAIDKPNGSATMYIAGSQQDTGTGSFASVDNFAQAIHGPAAQAPGAIISYWSQCFASLSPTLGQRLYTLVEDTNGDVQQFTGDVTGINELVVNDATGITSSTANQISTYYKNGLSTSGVILGVGTSARFNIGVTGPQNMQNVLRVSSANYNSPSTLGITGFAPGQYMWMSNPATSTSWTNVAANSVQWGCESIT